MSYDRYFANSIARLRREHRYRNFIELERLAGRFPRALWDAPEGPRDPTSFGAARINNPSTTNQLCFDPQSRP